jgi:hypothetical protein
MSKHLRGFLTFAAVLLTSSTPVVAHHGTAAYDKQKSVTVMGEVTKFDFSNPHAILAIHVRNADGTVVEWQGELTSPNNLVRAGWTRNTLKPGDQITIAGFPARSGEYLIWIQKLSKGGQTLPLGVGGGDN